MEKLNIIYIFGSGHSGSTLLSLLLGAHSSIECVGEMKSYERSLERGRACNCGKPVSECSYWKRVHERAGRLDTGSPPVLNSPDRQKFAEQNERFIRALLDSSGKNVLCDSSKSKTRLLRYLNNPLFDVTVLHLVRDGRATVFSNLKKSRAFFSYARQWARINMRQRRELFPAGLSLERYHSMRYEDLVLQPEKTIGAFLSKVGLSFEPAQMTEWTTENHHIAGNHMARRAGQALHLDTKYLDALTPAQWFFATSLQVRPLNYFNYPLSRSRTKAILNRQTSAEASTIAPHE